MGWEMISLAGVWEPTRMNHWVGCPEQLSARNMYQMTVRDDGTWVGGRAGSKKRNVDNFRGRLENVRGRWNEGHSRFARRGRASDKWHGEYKCEFTLKENGELKCKFGSGLRVKYYFTRAGGPVVVDNNSDASALGPLLAMGFSEHNCRRALAKSGGASVETWARLRAPATVCPLLVTPVLPSLAAGHWLI